jgi:hypothetical protein
MPILLYASMQKLFRVREERMLMTHQLSMLSIYQYAGSLEGWGGGEQCLGLTDMPVCRYASMRRVFIESEAGAALMSPICRAVCSVFSRELEGGGAI